MTRLVRAFAAPTPDVRGRGEGPRNVLGADGDEELRALLVKLLTPRD